MTRFSPVLFRYKLNESELQKANFLTWKVANTMRAKKHATPRTAIAKSFGTRESDSSISNFDFSDFSDFS